jgi:hypothetical protein
MAFGDTVFTYKNSGLGTAEASVAITNTPVSGNMLVFGVGRAITHTAGGDWGTPSTWTRIHDSGINTGNLGGAWFFKISDGTETSVATAASPADVSAENVDNIASVVTSQTSGTTSTTAQNDELALAFFAADRMDTVDTSRAYSNSFTEVVFTDQQTTRAAAILAKKVLSATGTVECTFSVTDTGDEMYGSVATFKKLAAGGSVVPVLMRHYRSRKS